MNNTMKKGIMLLALAALVAGGVFAQRVGDTVQVSGSSWTVQSVSGDTMTLRKTQGTTFTSIAAFQTWLASQSTNTAANAYNVKLNISNLGGGSTASGSLGAVLRANANKYVNIDLSGSMFTSIEARAFEGCQTLTGLTIGKNVTSTGVYVFQAAINLTSITFLGTMPLSGFSPMSAAGNLRANFYATDASNGTPGTYTTTAPMGNGSVWTKQ